MNDSNETKTLPTAAEETEKTAAVGDIPPLEGIHEIEAAIESILFAAGYPVKYTKLSEVLGLEVKDIKSFLEHMEPAFNGPDSHRGVQLLLLPDTAQLCTKERFAPYIREALGVRRGGNLSASSMEVLAVGRPMLYGTTDKFLRVFGINSLADLPATEALAVAAQVESEKSAEEATNADQTDAEVPVAPEAAE